MVNSRLKKLKSQRQAIRLNVDKLIQESKDLTNVKPDGINSRERVQVVGEKIRDYLSRLESLDEQVLDALEEDEDIDAEATVASQYLEKMLDASKSVEIFLSDLSIADRADRDDSESQPGAYGTAKLPKLHIQPFDGDPLSWQEFWDIFTSTIHERHELSPIEKLKYLKSYLTSEALEVIAGYRLTSENYEVVVNLLKERFGDPEIAIHAHMEKLLAIESFQSGQPNLQYIYNECERHIRSLVALGLTEDMFGRVFTPIILSKLPKQICIQFHRQRGTDPWKLSTLRKLLKDEILAREMSDRYVTPKEPVAPSQPIHLPAERTQVASRPFIASGKRFQPSQGTLVNNSEAGLSCCFCGGSHYADKCKMFRSLTQRKQALGNRCFKCLGSDHTFKQCKRQSVCFYCKSSTHHSSLCPNAFGSVSGVIRQNGPIDKTRYRAYADCSSRNYSALGKGTSSLLHPGKRVQMHMALVHFPDVNLKARVLFDTGSSRSYITSKLCKALKIQPTRDEIMYTSRFGDFDRTAERYDATELSLPTAYGEALTVSVLVTEQISCPIHKYPIDVERNQILKQVKLADELTDNMEDVVVDILIGQDYFYEFVGSERVQLSNGLFLVNSKFGYIIAGRIPSDSSLRNDAATVLFRSTLPVISDNIERFWSLEDIGVKDDPYSLDDERALRQFNDTIKRNSENRYEVTWPWKQDNPELPDNYGLAFGCLKSLIARIRPQSQVIAEYDKTIENQLENNVIERAPPSNNSTHVHYIPHHCVIRKDKATTKLRIVSL